MAQNDLDKFQLFNSALIKKKLESYDRAHDKKMAKIFKSPLCQEFINFLHEHAKKNDHTYEEICEDFSGMILEIIHMWEGHLFEQGLQEFHKKS